MSLLSLDRFRFLFYCFYCWLWTSKHWLVTICPTPRLHSRKIYCLPRLKTKFVAIKPCLRQPLWNVEISGILGHIFSIWPNIFWCLTKQKETKCMWKLKNHTHVEKVGHNSEFLIAVLHPKEIWGQCFQIGIWSAFLNTSKLLLMYVVLQTFIHFYLAACSFEQNKREVIVYLRNLSDSILLFFLFIFGDIFLGAHNLWTLPLSVWIRPYIGIYWWTWKTNNY